ncbi:unnamed protein product [Absidia cylindrospora]
MLLDLLLIAGAVVGSVTPAYANDATGASLIRAPLIRNEQAKNFLRRAITENKFRKREQLINADGREYLIQVGVGTPPQVFNLTLDTGSSELWVPSTKCQKTVCPYDRFDPARSSTLKQSNEAFSIQYGSGSAKGTYGEEAITVGTATVSNQKIGLVSSTKDILGVVAKGAVQSNGIFGLGYPGLNSARGVQNDVPFAFNLMNQNKQMDRFSIYLTNSHQKPSIDSGGEIIFGGVDETKFTGDLTYVPVVDYHIEPHQPVSPNVGQKNGTRQGGTYLYWTVPGQGVSTSKNYKYTPDDVVPFVLDTGTTLSYLPSKIVKGIVSSITSPKKPTFDAFNLVYRVDCALRKNTKDTVHFQLSTSKTAKTNQPVDIAVPVSQLVIPIDTNDAATATSCMFAIAPADESDSLSSAPTWLLGESTLRAVYAVYDMGQNRVGLAPFSPNGNVSTTAPSGAVNGGGPSATGSSAASTSSAVENQQSGEQPSSSSAARSLVTLTPYVTTLFTLVYSIVFY